MSEPTFPAWLNIDAIVPAEQRDRIPACLEAAHKLLDAVLDFNTDWGEYIVEMEKGIWERTSEAQAIDDWGYFIQGLIGWQVVEDVLELVHHAAEILTGDSSRLEYFTKAAEAVGTPHQEDGLRALGALRSGPRPMRHVPDSGF